MNQLDILQLFIQGGAVGITVYIIYTVRKLASNHLEHNTRALSSLEKAITKLTTVVDNKLDKK